MTCPTCGCCTNVDGPAQCTYPSHVAEHNLILALIAIGRQMVKAAREPGDVRFDGVAITLDDPLLVTALAAHSEAFPNA